jgi:hypothetical protein
MVSCRRHEAGQYSPTEGSLLELLATVQAVTELEQADIVLCYLVNQVPCSAQLAQGKLVVIFVIKDVHKGRQERVNVVEHGKVVQDGAELFVKSVLGEFDLAHIKVAYPADFKVLVDNLCAPALEKHLEVR